MKVFKFGGASINSIERIQHLGKILTSYSEEKLLIIISAMGKTTNALEAIVNLAAKGEQQQALAAKQRPFRDDALAHRDLLPFEQRVMGNAGLK